MANEKNKKIKPKSIAFYGTVVMALLVIGYFWLNLNKDSKKELNQTSDPVSQNSSSIASKETTPTSETATSTTGQIKEDNATSSPDNPKVTTTPSQNNKLQSTIVQDNSVQGTEKVKQAENTNQKLPQQTPEQVKATPIPTLKVDPTAKPDNAAIKIIKSEVTSTAKFYPYNVDGVAMEVIAVKAYDGTIRTALNTCQVCFDSGRGYYEQVGEYFVCQNCGNRFHIDQVEKVKGGCNPVPILDENKQDAGEYITISKDFMASQKEYFSKWKKK